MRDGVVESSAVADVWQLGSPYEQYIGRWSRRVAPLFLTWLGVPAGKAWVDVGCGTGALTTAIADGCAPRALVGVEPSEGFLKLAARTLGNRAHVTVGSADALPLGPRVADVVVSGLVLNFVPDTQAALAEMVRVTVPGGSIAAYVWDYADGMEVIRLFWDTAVRLDPAAAPLHEGVRFPLCDLGRLRQAFEAAGLAGVATTSLEVTAEFAGFEEYWRPFLGGQGPAPAYAAGLSNAQRLRLRDELGARVAATAGQGFALRARALAVRGTVVG